MAASFRHLFRRLSQPVFWRLYRWYLSTPHWYRYDGLEIRLLPTVFHPGWLISTKVLLEYFIKKDIKHKRVLELGAGSGMIALAAARKGAIVTASDINPEAIRAIKESSAKNNIPILAIESDLFQNLQGFLYDYILINPPYYPKQARDAWELAFYCGEHFEYFRALFSQIHPFLVQRPEVYLILNEHCDVKTIRKIAQQNLLDLRSIFEININHERHYIFEIIKHTKG